MTSHSSEPRKQEEALLKEIAAVCETAIEQKSIPDSLPRQVRQYALLVRSLLDGCAAELRAFVQASSKDAGVAPASGDIPVRYPIASDAPALLRAVRTDFPGLTERHPELLRLFMDNQPFLDGDSWLSLVDRLASGEEPPALAPRTGGGLVRLSLMTYHGEEISFASDSSTDTAVRSATGATGTSAAAWTGINLAANDSDLLVALLTVHDGLGALLDAAAAAVGSGRHE
ncbi:hypothetical protein [Gorillibacterium sp. sgz500922]|uniref:hypothetical protein n=1 Tax=Gorillibacterium sp. sgz500922 TaxID=3446694 RepID=UPI003F6757AA